LPSEVELRTFYRDYPTTRTASGDLHFLIERSRAFFDHFLEHSGLKGAEPSELDYLEIGFGNGASLLAAAAVGFRTSGIDVDEAAVARARAAASGYGVRIDCVATDIRSLRGNAAFDVVRASQVIEHTSDPEAFLRGIAARQPLGGRLILELPNNNAVFWRAKNMLRRRYGRMRYYKSLKVGEHLSGFTKKSIAILLDRAGFRILRIQDYPLRHRFLQPENLVWYPSVADGLRRTIVDRSSYHFLKSLIPVFDRFASALGGSGTHLSVWAQKCRSC
jgi:2-polyprenyl-3-methyl-5-hydroxy-6-metoxy-1,4-benzoquinol methylase